MSRVSITVPTLLNGVSQQPDQLRLTSQGDLQTNFYGSISEGLTRRAPSQFLRILDPTPISSDCYVHTIDRGPGERYLVMVTNGNLRVFDIAGNERTVSFPNGKAYLNFQTGFSSAKSSFKALNTNDETFILNRGYVVPATAASVSTFIRSAVTVKQGNYGTTYSIVVTLNGTVYTSTKTTSLTLASDITPNKIITDLNAGFSPALPGGLNAVVVDGSLLLFLNTSVTPITGTYTVAVTDSAGGSDTSLLHAGVAGAVTDLPESFYFRAAPFVKIIGNTTPYYVSIVGNYAAAGSDNDGFAVASVLDVVKGIWVECSGDNSGFDNAGVPWRLVKNTDGTFTFDKGAYTTRQAGDTLTAPTPSFVGNTIQDMVLYKGRLGFLSANKVIFSQPTKYLNFWPTTVTAALDNAPIDVKAEAFGVTTLQWAVQYEDNLLLFSDKVQLTLNGNPILTTKTVSITPVTAYDGSLTCPPVPAGQSVLFAYDLGAFGGLREYTNNSILVTNTAADVTGQCKRYIPFQITKIASSTYDDLALVLSNGEPGSVFVYKYFYSGQDKIQSALSKWTFGGTVLDCSFLGSDLFIVINRTNLGTVLEKITFAGMTDTPNVFITYLDTRITEASCSSSYNATTDQTTLTLPFAASGVSVVCRTASANRLIGENLNVLSALGTSLVVSGDMRALQFYAGFTFESRYRFSKQYPRFSSGAGSESVDTSGRLVLRKGKIQHYRSGYFRVEVTPFLRPLNTYVFTGINPGSSDLGVTPNISSVFPFAINTLNQYAQIDLVNDSPFPSTFLGAAFEGEYTTRSQRI